MKIAFQFADLQAFLWMNGHGPYVWACYAITFAGLVLVGVASIIIGLGELQIGALVLLLGLPLDALDGAVARAMQRKDQFGALLDSTLDRYADAFIFAGLGYYFAVHLRFEMLLLARLGCGLAQAGAYPIAGSLISKLVIFCSAGR